MPQAPPGNDPFAAPLPKPQYPFPDSRFSRLNMDPSMMRLVQHWWDGLSPNRREDEFRVFAQTFEAELGQWVNDVNGLPEATVRNVYNWVDGSARPTRDAAIALEVEQARPKPRNLPAAVRNSDGPSTLADWLTTRAT